MRPLQGVLRAVLLAVPACGALVGIDEFAVAPGDGGGIDPDAARLVAGRCAGFEYRSATCAQCIDDKCCTQANACRASATCAPLVECLHACPPDNGICRNACWARQSKTDAAAAALFACEFENCSSACVTCAAEWDRFGETCGDCLRANCCDLSLACQSDPECRAYTTCLVEHCGVSENPGCELACEIAHPLGVELLFSGLPFWPERSSIGPVLCAYNNGCGYSACGWGTHWDCIGQWDWPSPASATADARIHVAPWEASATRVPVESATVTACRLLPGLTCGRLASGVTDANGDATLPNLPLPFGTPAAPGYFLIEHESLPKALVFLGAPVVSGQRVDTRSVFGRAFRDSTDSLFDARGLQRDPTRGAIFVEVLDCVGSAPVCATLSDGGAGSEGPYYFQGFLPDFEAKCTNTGGIGLFVNVPTGRPVRIEAEVDGVIKAWADVIVEADTTTSVVLYPYRNPP